MGEVDYKFPGPVPKEALEWFKKKGLRPAFSHLEVWKEEHARAFTIAKVMERDILEHVQTELTKALAEGRTFEDWRKEVWPQLQKSGWLAHAKTVGGVPRRLRTIYDTNMRTSRAHGQWQRIQRTKKVLPFLMYALGPSERHREEHVAWAGTILPVDDPWWDEHYCPNGWGCKCHTIQLGRREVERRGGPSERPKVERVRWKNKVTGKSELIPKGIDPGWNYNPGKHPNKGLLDAAKKADIDNPPIAKPKKSKKK